MADQDGPLLNPAANLLSFTKNAANDQLIRYLNGMTTNALSRYPEAEVQSWPYQKSEAEAIVRAGRNAALSMAPMLAGVCAVQFGEASDFERLAQVQQKSHVVLELANQWLAVATFVNGLRAKTQDTIEAAADPVEVNEALSAAMAAAEQFRAAAGL